MADRTDHRFVRGQFRQRVSIDAIDLAEISCGPAPQSIYCRQSRLFLRDMEGIRGGDFVEVAFAAKNRRFEAVL